MITITFFDDLEEKQVNADKISIDQGFIYLSKDNKQVAVVHASTVRMVLIEDTGSKEE